MSLKLAKRKEEFLKAISNHHRLEILEILLRRETSVGSLVEQIGLSQSALSQHLTKLREQGLVTTRRSAQTIYYSCHDEAVAQTLGALADIFSRRAPEYVPEENARMRLRLGYK